MRAASRSAPVFLKVRIPENEMRNPSSRNASAAFADGDHLRGSGKSAQLDDSIRGAVSGVVRVDSDGRENVRVVFGDFQRTPIGLDRSDRANRDNLCYPGFRRPSKNLVELG